jgi:hypothetical protein
MLDASGVAMHDSTLMKGIETFAGGARAAARDLVYARSTLVTAATAATHNSQLTTHNSQLTTHNCQLVET